MWLVAYCLLQTVWLSPSLFHVIPWRRPSTNRPQNSFYTENRRSYLLFTLVLRLLGLLLGSFLAGRPHWDRSYMGNLDPFDWRKATLRSRAGIPANHRITSSRYSEISVSTNYEANILQQADK
ncbi:uncharacterized protein FRV6_08555 [Fusarium oxysporum]|uniref:Uncharacterized protein n=1 Tax=Fusarium oxysporum TaxID=5507 RepID=A0A2H3T6S6_FUSOX|nr:uncharacterized protein FRV6_08555 [Fusarium oxysporum]